MLAEPPMTQYIGTLNGEGGRRQLPPLFLGGDDRIVIFSIISYHVHKNMELLLLSLFHSSSTFITVVSDEGNSVHLPSHPYSLFPTDAYIAPY